MPHEADPAAPLVSTQRRYRSNDRSNVLRFGGDGGFDYGKSVCTRACRMCAKPVEVVGTAVWWGKGKWAGLNGETSDTPALLKTIGEAQLEDEGSA